VYSEHAPFFMGKEKGYYEAEGIDLDIQEGRGSAVSIQAVAANSATFGYVDVPTMIRAATKGAPVKAVGVALQLSPMSVMGLAEKNIKTPKDIIGKTVAMTPGDSMSQIWPLFLKKTGLQEGQYKVVSGDGQTKLNAVINGQADLLLGYVMDQNIKIQDATKKPVTVIRFADYGITMVSSGLIAHKDTLANKADLVRRFMRATTRAFEETEKNPEGQRQGRPARHARRRHQAHDAALPLGRHQGPETVARVDERHQRVARPAGAIRRPGPCCARQGGRLGDERVPASMTAVVNNIVALERGARTRADAAPVHKTYRTREGDIETLKPLDFDIRAGEFVSVVGPSGCGKSTLMKMVAGLLPISGGALEVSGQAVRGPQTDVGIVFQSALLLPWRRVLDNILLQAEIRGLPMAAARKRAQALIEMAGLQGFEQKYPWQLSGGMQQRVAILRALLHDPSVLLMDEPFGALDAMTRERMNLELQRIWMNSRKTVLLITHSIPEAIFLSDCVFVMSERPGRIVQVYDINLPRPRPLDVMGTEAFAAYARSLRAHFYAQGQLDAH
jgi:NitT/TauT family transport system ATP-binding protein